LLGFDFSKTHRDEANALFELFDASVRAAEPASVRLLANFEEVFHASELKRRCKEA
jgi:hypothetical protein